MDPAKHHQIIESKKFNDCNQTSKFNFEKWNPIDRKYSWWGQRMGYKNPPSSKMSRGECDKTCKKQSIQFQPAILYEEPSTESKCKIWWCLLFTRAKWSNRQDKVFDLLISNCSLQLGNWRKDETVGESRVHK